MIIENNSKLNNIWEINSQSIEKIQTIQNFIHCSLLTSKIIANKNIPFDSLETYINPTLKKTWINTNKIPNIEQATEEILKIIDQKGKIGIIGDYDVDGLTSTTILKEFCDLFQIETIIWIPSRKDGYGPSDSALSFFQKNKVDLLIMVDCGTTSYSFTSQYNNKIIIIDHHNANKTAENCIIINPNANIYKKEILQELKEMSAASLLFFTISHILKKINHPNYQETLKSMLDLIALSTICDMIPLNNLNRALVKEGLKLLKNQNRIGLSQLINFANIKLPITAKDIAYNIGPRLNATGRIDTPEISLKLLLAKTYEETSDIIYKIEQTNNYRKDLQEVIFAEAIELAKNSKDKIICLASENWNAGVVGIIAAMIQNETKKPTIIGNITNNEIKASARSNSINIGILIEKAAENKIISKGGGHKAAAGLTCLKSQWEEFKKWINGQEFKVTKETIKIDAISTLKEIDNDYNILSPFGIANEAPKILIKDVITNKIINKQTYYQIILEENYQTQIFFVNNSQKKLIEALSEAHIQKIKINIVISLNEKNFTLEDISY